MNERSRLLNSTDSDDNRISSSDGVPLSTRPNSARSYTPFNSFDWAETWSTWKVPIICYIFALLVDSGDMMRATPKTQLFESIICRHFYSDKGLGKTSQWSFQQLDIQERQRMCKVAEVQGKLVTIKAWLKIVENLLSLILAIPFGNLASKKSRNFVITLGLIGQMASEAWILMVCYFADSIPFEFVLISALLKSAGGGSAVISAMVYAILSDVLSPDKRAQGFFHLASSMLLTEVIAPSLGSSLMQIRSVYTPLICGFALELVGAVFLAMIPNTAKLVQQQTGVENFPTEDDGSDDEQTSMLNPTIEYKKDSMYSRLKVLVGNFLAPLTLVWTLVSGNRNLLLVNMSFLVITLGRGVLDLLVQYTSKRFSWTLAEANYLLSFRAVANLILFLIILPAISEFLKNRRGMPSMQVDLWIARGSSLFGIIGPIMIALSPSPGLMMLSLLLFTCSFGFHAALQSYATSLVQPARVTILYSSIAVVSIIGTLISSPLIAATFTLGLKIGGAGLGLPFFVTAAFFTVSAVGAWAACMPK